MADFCKQCSMYMFGFDTKDFAGLVSPRQWKKRMAADVLCEECGPIQVDPNGKCISKYCKKHGKKRGRKKTS